MRKCYLKELHIERILGKVYADSPLYALLLHQNESGREKNERNILMKWQYTDMMKIFFFLFQNQNSGESALLPKTKGVLGKYDMTNGIY